MPSFRITVAYDGTDYVGWQRQANGISIQGLLEDALAKLDGRAVAVAGAGRTDSGVHALGQVAAFTLERAIPADAVVRALNANLPDAIRLPLPADEVGAVVGEGDAEVRHDGDKGRLKGSKVERLKGSKVEGSKAAPSDLRAFLP